MDIINKEVSDYNQLIFWAGVYCATGFRSDCARRVLELYHPIQSDPERLRVLKEMAIAQKMLPMVHLCLDAGGASIPDEWPCLVEAYRVAIKANSNALAPLLGRMTNSGARVMVLKGLDLLANTYPEGMVRAMFDVDLLVQFNDMELIDRVLCEAGYLQGAVDKKKMCVEPYATDFLDANARRALLPQYIRLDKIDELNRHAALIEEHLGHLFLVCGGEVYCPLECGVHTNLATDFDVVDAWRNTRFWDLRQNVQIEGQSYEDMLWFMGVKIYYETNIENKVYMRQLIDFLAVLWHHHEEIDWDRLVLVMRKHAFHCAMYYPLYHSREILNGIVPDEVLEECTPVRDGVARARDFGDFIV